MIIKILWGCSNLIQHDYSFVRNVLHISGSYLPLPEDRDLQGFIPLEKSFSDLR
jgi:hypothetical protein